MKHLTIKSFSCLSSSLPSKNYVIGHFGIWSHEMRSFMSVCIFAKVSLHIAIYAKNDRNVAVSMQNVISTSGFRV